MRDTGSLSLGEGSRPYVCTDCGSIVAAKMSGIGGFNVGCRCTTVPVVPQMGQAETPDNWRVRREECCQDAHASNLKTVYGVPGVDVECPDCGAGYRWDGEMARLPDADHQTEAENETIA